MIVTSSDGIARNHLQMAHYYNKHHPRIIRDNKIQEFCVHANQENDLVYIIIQRTGVFCENSEAPAEIVFVGLFIKQDSVRGNNINQPF